MVKLASERLAVDYTDADLEAAIAPDGVVNMGVLPCQCGGFLVLPLPTVWRLRKQARKGQTLSRIVASSCPSCDANCSDFLPVRDS